MASQDKVLNDLLDSFEPKVAAAFRAAIEDWRAGVDVAAFIRALSNRNIAEALAALHLAPAALQPLLDALASAYQTAGQQTVAQWQSSAASNGMKLTIRFNMRDPAAEAELKFMSSKLITDITTSQRKSVQTALEAGLKAGDGPGTVALDIVGRIGPDGKRQGGVIGLSNSQAIALSNAKAELASSDPKEWRSYLSRELRDHRFDSNIRQAIADGKKIDAETRTKMIVSYSNRLLKFRGDTIARTETLPALHASQYEAVRQAISNGTIKADAVSSTWKDSRDNRVRHSHRALNGQKRKFGVPFVSPDSGARMRYPGDRAFGAPASEIIKCRCIAPIRVDFLAGIR